MEYTDEPLKGLNDQPHLNESGLSSELDNAPQGMEIPLYIYILASLVNAVIFLVGTIGNIFVIVVVIKVRNMRTPTNVFLLNLSAADVLVLLVCQPAGLLEFFGKDRWFLGELMCKLVPLMENGVLHVSILTMLAVTFERYHAICHPLKYRMTSTISATVKIIAGIWIFGTILTLPFLIMTDYEDALFYDGSPIKVCRTKVNEMWRYCYTIFISVAFFALPLFILIGFYVCIIKQLMSDKLTSLAQNDRTAVNTLRSRKQVVQMLIFIIVLFFISLFPIRVVSLWLIFTPTAEVIKIGLEPYLNLMCWVRILMYINSAGNPIIYSLTSTKFKSAFKRVLGRRNSFPQGSVTSTKYIFKRVNNNRRGNVVNTPLPCLNGTQLSSVKSKLSSKTSSSKRANDREEDGLRRNFHRNEKPLLNVRLILYPKTPQRRSGNSQTTCDYIPLQIIDGSVRLKERNS
ncbi:QRFP-like peptide receptor [Mercenaria mercenaria]|uniref:QRFP-like peptide receptor n=1 Tax=Mercenaria mercenaria TaxID=6596 RepID=UPI00234F9469|nr:QRFP-like peptide receptor [Mercenaria mercenaria]